MDNNEISKRDYDELICEIVFQKNKLFNETDVIQQKEILNMIVDDLKGTHVPYDSITKIVFGIDNIDEMKELCNTACEKLNAVQANNPSDKDGKKYISDFERHIELSKIQKIAITRESIKAEKTADEAEKAADEAEDKLKEVSEGLHDVNDIKSKIYSDFISILGIFTAITFATFGGLQLLGKVFGNAISKDNHVLGTALVLGSLYIFGTYLLLLSLFNGIDKLVNRDKVKEYKYTNSIFLLISFFCGLMLAVGILFVLKFK